jgi:hypothetical protein
MTPSSFLRFPAPLLITALVSNSPAFAAPKPADADAAKAKVEARGVGQGVRVVLADKTEAKGLIVSVGADSFIIKAKDQPQPREIQYAQVAHAHRGKLSAGQDIAIVTVIGGAAVGIAVAVIAHHAASVYNSQPH